MLSRWLEDCQEENLSPEVSGNKSNFNETKATKKKPNLKEDIEQNMTTDIGSSFQGSHS